MMKSWQTAAVLSLVMLAAGGCSQIRDVSAAEIMTNVIETEQKFEGFYGEMEFIIYEEAQGQPKRITSKEYRSKDGELKIEQHGPAENEHSISLLTEEQKIMYFPDKLEAIKMETDAEDLEFRGPKEQFIKTIDMSDQGQTYELAGEEELLGRKVYRILIESSDEMISSTTLWVDQKTWFPIKMTAELADTRYEMAYTKLDFSPTFKKDEFTLNLPKNVKVDTLETQEGEKVNIKEAEKVLGKPVLFFSDTNQMKLGYVEKEKVDGKYWCNFEYNDLDNKPLFSMTVSVLDKEQENLKSNGRIRGKAAEIVDTYNIVIWNESGLQYFIRINQPEKLTVKDLARFSKEMKWSSEKLP